MDYFHKNDLKTYVTHRKGETKIGERICTLRKGETVKALKRYADQGVKFCLFGIPESIGPLASYGKAGSENGWEAFLSHFLSLQSNRFLDGSDMLLLGQIDTKKLQKRAVTLKTNSDYYYTKLHIICAELDEMVAPLAQSVFESGMIPIVIGGGHNNTFPLLQGAAVALGRKRGINAINLDQHANFRVLEGRHSGNGFSYAKEANYLYKYFAFGIHQSYNNENMLRVMDNTRNVKYEFLEDITYLDKHLMTAIDYVFDDHVPCGIELDMDAIRDMPSSAQSSSGFSLEQARHYIRKCAKSLKAAYLHLPEAAPNSAEDKLKVGKALSYLVADFVKTSKK